MVSVSKGGGSEPGGSPRHQGITPEPIGGSTRGFSTLELIAALAVLSMLTALFLAAERTPPLSEVERSGRRLALDIERTLDEAVAREGIAVVHVSGSPPAPGGETGEGRYLAVATGSGAPQTPSASASWRALGEGVAWGRGSARNGPRGEPLERLRHPERIVCDASRSCGVGPSGVVSYHLTSTRDPSITAAVSLTRFGTVQLYRYRAGDGSWSSLAR